MTGTREDLTESETRFSHTTSPYLQDIKPHSLPCAELVLAFLELYKQKRSPQKQSLGNSFKHYLEDTIYQITGYCEPTDNVTEGMIADLESQICYARDSNDWREWYSLVFLARDVAPKAQAQKYLLTRSTEVSLLYITCHAIACVVINELKKCKIDKYEVNQKTIDNIFDAQLEELKEELKKATQSRIDAVLKNQGQERYDQARKQEKIIMKILAYLCDTLSVIDAKELGLLKSLDLPAMPVADAAMRRYATPEDNIKDLLPLVLNNRYDKLTYACHYQGLEEIKRLSFEKFKKKKYAEEDDRHNLERIRSQQTPATPVPDTTSQPGNQPPSQPPATPVPDPASPPGNQTPIGDTSAVVPPAPPSEPIPAAAQQATNQPPTQDPIEQAAASSSFEAVSVAALVHQFGQFSPGSSQTTTQTGVVTANTPSPCGK